MVEQGVGKMSINQIYDGIKDYIEDNLSRYLDPADNIATPMFKAILRSSVVDILGLKIYPTLMMEYGPVEVERETLNSDRFKLPISFYCISAGGDSEKLQVIGERYVWALKKLFEYDISLDGVVDRLDIQGFSFSPAFARQQSFVHTGVIDVVFDVLITHNKEEK